MFTRINELLVVSIFKDHILLTLLTLMSKFEFSFVAPIYGGPYLQTQQTILENALSHNIFLIIKKALQIMHNTFQIPRNTFQILRNTF